MRPLLNCVLFALLCIAGAVYAAPTGYTADFNGGLAKWPANPGYKVSQADGVATLHVNKLVRWAGQNMSLGDTYDFSAHPYLTVQLKTSAPMMLDVYMMGPGGIANIHQRIRAVPDFQTYCFDFSAEKQLDPHKISDLIFTVNGAGTSWDGMINIKALRIGDQAARLPDIEAVEDQEWYHDTGTHSARLTGLSHIKQLTLSDADKVLQHVNISAIAQGRATMTYDVIPGAHGTALATLTAEGEEGYAAVARTFTVLVEDNLPPTIDAHPPVTTQIGKPCMVRFTGVSDGNATADQPLTITVRSSNPAVIRNGEIQTDNPHGGRYLYLRCTPTKAGDTVLTLTLDDKCGGTSTSSTSLAVHAVAQWNNQPTLGAIANVKAFVASGRQQLPLTGISDGDNGKQHLTFSAVSSDHTILADPTVDYTGGDTAILHYTPTMTPGAANITLTVTDDGGTLENNGNQTVSQAFSITTRVRPIMAYTMNLTDYSALKPSLRAEDGVAVSPDTDGGTPVLKIACKDKFTFGGLWLALPNMDLTKAPYLTVDVKCKENIDFNMYFYDGTWQRNDSANRLAHIKGGEWQTVTFDFSGDGQMNNSKSQPIDRNWIISASFIFHPKFAWPFSNWTGDLYFRNLRIGTAADMPKRNPVVTIAPLPAQVYMQGSGVQHLQVTGLSVDNSQPISLTCSEIAALNPGGGLTSVTPVVSAVSHGTATLTLTAGQAVHEVLALTASAPGADPVTTMVSVDVVNPTTAQMVSIDTSKTFQTIRGFGTSCNGEPDVDLYTRQLGASAMRIATESEFNPTKDTSDVNVLNRARLNYQSFDFDYYRRLHAAGVESFILTSWSPPAWQKINFSVDYQNDALLDNSDKCDNRLDYDCYDDFAKTMVAAVRMFQEEADITFDAVSLQNEPSFCETYGSAILDPARMISLIKITGAHFDKAGIHTRIFMPEQVFQIYNMFDYIHALNADPEAQKYSDIIATHSYDDKGVLAKNPDFSSWTKMYQAAQQGTGPKEVWMSETDPRFNGWDTALNYSMALYGALEYGNISLWTQWNIDSTLLNNNVPNDSFWVVRQYFKYIRPGAKRVASTCTGDHLYVTSFLNDAKHGGKLVSIITNRTATPAVIQLATVNRHVTAWQVITTDPIRHGEEMGEHHAGEMLLLPPNSVTTVVEK